MKTSLKLILMVSIFVMAGGCIKSLGPNQIMDLNRQGKWDEASISAEKLVVESDKYSFGQVCQAYHSLIYSEIRMKRKDRAIKYYNDFQAYRGLRSYPSYLLWMEKEMETLLKELEPKPRINWLDYHDDFWNKESPAGIGLNLDAVTGFIQLCEQGGASGAALIYKGKLLDELDFPDSNKGEDQKAQKPEISPPAYHAPSSSLMAILTGICLEKGYITSLDDKIMKYIPAYTNGYQGDVTILHLLTMTSGIISTQKSWQEMVDAVDVEKLIMRIKPEYKPGEFWAYSGEALQVLGLVLQKASEVNLQVLAQNYLFEPLGMLSANLDENAKGQALVYYQYFINPLDWAKIGLLVLNMGQWEGRKIISSEYIRRMTQVAPEQNLNYYLGWNKFHQPPGFGDILFAGSYIAVYPDLELVAVRMASRGRGRAMDRAEPNEAAGYFFSLFNQ